MAFGFVVDDDGQDKTGEGGAARFAYDLADRALDPHHLDRCPSCQVLGEVYACVGLIPTPLSTEAERWLVEQLPEDIEQLPGYLLRKAISEYGYTGELGESLRRQGLLTASGAFTRHFGPFFRRFTVSSSQLLEEMLLAGDVAPSHALAILIHLGGLLIDDEKPLALESGAQLAELMQEPTQRRSRTQLAIDDIDESDDPSLAGLKRYLGSLYAGFVLDTNVLVFAPEPDPNVQGAGD